MKKITEVKITITEIDGVIVNVHPEVRNIELKKDAPVKQKEMKVLKPKEPKKDEFYNLKNIPLPVPGVKYHIVYRDCDQKMDILKRIFGDSTVTNLYSEYLYSEYLKEVLCNPVKANANLK